MPNRAKDWFHQAERDLNHAKNSLKDDYFEWSCFASHQAAEKAVKAVYEKLHGEAWGHTISKLLRDLPKEVAASDTLIEYSLYLDKLYIPTRYPNGFDSGAPGEFFTLQDAKRAIEYAEEIIDFCKSKIFE